MLRNKLFLFASLLFAPYFSFAADGTVLVIDKIAPKNGAFVGVVDSSQAVTNVSNFNNNLSSADDTVQKALDTLDNLAVGGGGGASTLAVGTGTASNFTTNVTSPTAAVSFLGTQFTSLSSGSTNFISIKNSGVAAGSYGSATQVSSVTVSADGRVTGSANVTISLTNSNLQAGTYSNLTIPAANIAAGSLGSSVIASSIAANAVQDASIVGVSGSKIIGTGTIPNAAINGSSITKSGVLVAGTNVTITPGSGITTISAASASPVGPNNSVQFSSFGALSGSSNLTFSPTDYMFTVGWSSSTRVARKQTYTKFVDGFFDTKYIYDQIYTPTDDGGSYAGSGYYIFGSTTGLIPGNPSNSDASSLFIKADDGCPSAVLYANGGITSSGGGVSANCYGSTISNGSGEQINVHNLDGVNLLLHNPLGIYGYSGEAARLLFRDDDGLSPNDGVILQAPSTVDQIAGVDNLILVLPSTGGAIGDALKITSVSSNEYSLGFGPVSGGGGGTTIWSKLDGSALDSAVSTINVTAPLTATSSPSGQINIGVLSSSVTLQGNTFNTGSSLVQLSGGLIPNSLISASSVTKQGVITAGAGISVTNGSGLVTIAATGSGVTGSTNTISLTIDGQGSAIVAGSTRSITVPFQCVISSWSVVADASGSLGVHLASSTFNNYPTITNITGGGNGPSLSSQSKKGAAVSGWAQTTIDAGSVLSFVVDSASTVKWATVVLWVIRQ